MALASDELRATRLWHNFLNILPPLGEDHPAHASEGAVEDSSVSLNAGYRQLAHWVDVHRSSDQRLFTDRCAQVSLTARYVDAPNEANLALCDTFHQERHSCWLYCSFPTVQLEALVKAGCPDHMRGEVWKVFLDVGSNKAPGHYKLLVQLNTGQDCVLPADAALWTDIGLHASTRVQFQTQEVEAADEVRASLMHSL
jgi:hypothetical protein